jgi:hypothetical protein
MSETQLLDIIKNFRHQASLIRKLDRAIAGRPVDRAIDAWRFCFRKLMGKPSSLPTELWTPTWTALLDGLPSGCARIIRLIDSQPLLQSIPLVTASDRSKVKKATDSLGNLDNCIASRCLNMRHSAFKSELWMYGFIQYLQRPERPLRNSILDNAGSKFPLLAAHATSSFRMQLFRLMVEQVDKLPFEAHGLIFRAWLTESRILCQLLPHEHIGIMMPEEVKYILDNLQVDDNPAWLCRCQSALENSVYGPELFQPLHQALIQKSILLLGSAEYVSSDALPDINQTYRQKKTYPVLTHQRAFESSFVQHQSAFAMRRALIWLGLLGCDMPILEAVWCPHQYALSLEQRS